MGEKIIQFPSNFGNFDKRLIDIGKKFKGMNVEIGVLDGAGGGIVRRERFKRNKRGKRLKTREVIKIAQNVNNATKAFYNCKGAPERNMPPRDYQTASIDKNSKKWADKLEAMLKAGKMTETQMLEAIGLEAMTDTVNALLFSAWPKNADSTLKQKGKWKKPLVDSGSLWKSINFQVLDENGKKIKVGK